MAQVIDDYGGVAYGGRRREKRKASSQVSMRCLDCHKLRYVLQRELNRASQPHCMDCGGALEEIDTSRKRRGLKTLEKAAPKRKSPTRRCPGCGLKIENNSGFHRHIKNAPECVTYCRQQHYSQVVLGKSVFTGTVHLAKVCSSPYSKPWAVLAVETSGVVTELLRSGRRYECTEFINDEFGPVELWRPSGTPLLDARRPRLEAMAKVVRRLNEASNG